MTEETYCRWLVRLPSRDVLDDWQAQGIMVPAAVFSFRASDYEQFNLKLGYDDLKVRPDCTPMPGMKVLDPRSGKNLSMANTSVKQHTLCVRNFLNNNPVRVIESSIPANLTGAVMAWRRAYCRSVYNWLLKYAKADDILLVASDLAPLFTKDMQLDTFREHDLLTRLALRY